MDKENKRKAKKYGLGIGGVAVTSCIILFLVVAFSGIPTTTPETPTTKLTSSFTLIDYTSGEDISEWVEISIWTADEDDLPFDDEDPYRLNNFEEIIVSRDAADTTIDLRDEVRAWIQFDPDDDSVYGGYADARYDALSDDFRPLSCGCNIDYIFYLYHLPSNVTITVLERGSSELVGGEGIWDHLDEWNYTYAVNYNRTTNGTFTTYFNVPWNCSDGLHYGDTGGDLWDIDDEEFATMSDEELFWLGDQGSFRTIAPFYSLNDDLGKDYDDDLDMVTNCFAVRYWFNDSVSTLDGARTQVNFTLSERDYNEIPAEVVFSAESIYVIFYEPINCYNHRYNFDFDISAGPDILIGNVTDGRIFTPYDDDNLGAWTQINIAPIFDVW